MGNEILFGIAAAPTIMVLIGAVRTALRLPDRFIPLMAIALGIAWNVAAKASTEVDVTYLEAGMIGVLSGLAAIGTYEGAKAVSKK